MVLPIGAAVAIATPYMLKTNYNYTSIKGNNMEWKLNQSVESEAVIDNSGVYTIISRIEKTDTH